MKLKLFVAVLLTLYFFPLIHAQSESHRWEPVVVNQKERIWYDASQLDTVKGNKFEVWILQMHKPPLSFSEIPQKIYRSQTLYAINLNTVKYGIMKVIYYGSSDNKIYDFDYHAESLPDELKYTYPVLDNSFLHDVIKKLSKIQKEENTN